MDRIKYDRPPDSTIPTRPSPTNVSQLPPPPPPPGSGYCYGMEASSREQKIKGKSNPRHNVQRHIHSYVTSLSNAPSFSSTTVICRGGHQHWQVGQMPDTHLIPDLWSKGVKYHTFSKTEGKDRALYRDLCRSLTVVRAGAPSFDFPRHYGTWSSFSHTTLQTLANEYGCFNDLNEFLKLWTIY
jgi:hypothetical protein